MYIPKNFQTTDQNEIVAFMKAYSFATIITAKENLPTATHLPFIISTREDKVILTSHFAKANSQWEDVEGHKCLVIFNQPHAYISPGHYEKELNVPTWNYFSVHAYGDAKLITDEKSTIEVLEATIKNYEAGYQDQWDKLPLGYKTKLVKGIVAFEVTVADLEAKKKLSQNKTEKEQKNIIDSLSVSQDKNERDLAGYMSQQLSKNTNPDKTT
ncbi:FMN-binding negative transcriptional regulator [Pedobacter sp.]|uniref:FMN-binding negative transcriptional regulator n=1 Tax=Pedobacter sp. TaxID=1411316 RepID=UPI003D7FFD5A